MIWAILLLVSGFLFAAVSIGTKTIETVGDEHRLTGGGVIAVLLALLSLLFGAMDKIEANEQAEINQGDLRTVQEELKECNSRVETTRVGLDRLNSRAARTSTAIGELDKGVGALQEELGNLAKTGASKKQIEELLEPVNSVEKTVGSIKELSNLSKVDLNTIRTQLGEVEPGQSLANLVRQFGAEEIEHAQSIKKGLTELSSRIDAVQLTIGDRDGGEPISILNRTAALDEAISGKDGGLSQRLEELTKLSNQALSLDGGAFDSRLERVERLLLDVQRSISDCVPKPKVDPGEEASPFKMVEFPLPSNPKKKSQSEDQPPN